MSAESIMTRLGGNIDLLTLSPIQLEYKEIRLKSQLAELASELQAIWEAKTIKNRLNTEETIRKNR